MDYLLFNNIQELLEQEFFWWIANYRYIKVSVLDTENQVNHETIVVRRATLRHICYYLLFLIRKKGAISN